MKPALLVLDAGGDLGRGVVEAALAAGRAVIAAAPDAEALDALRARHPRAPLTTLAGHTGSDGAAETLASALRDRRPRVQAVVAAIDYRGTAGRLLDPPADALRQAMDRQLLPHLYAARHLFPLLPGSVRTGYLMVGAAGREHPWAGHGPGSIAAAALPMLARVLHDEAGRRGLRVQLLSLATPVCGDSNRGHACSEWPSALSIGKAAMALLDRETPEAALPAVVEFAPSRAGRHLRDARALLETLSSLSPQGSSR